MTCEDCGGPDARLEPDWIGTVWLCAACVTRLDNYDPPDIDGEAICRDYPAERRDAQLAAREIKR